MGPALQLVSGGGAVQYTLTAAELSRFPGSLLASVAASSEADGNAVVMDLDALGDDNPLAAWPQATGLVVGLYRTGRLALSQLAHAISSLDDNSWALIERLQCLLDFLGLPERRLCSWIDVKQASLRQLGALRFCYDVLVVELLDRMLEHTPLTLATFKESAATSQVPRAAAFLITAGLHMERCPDRPHLQAHRLPGCAAWPLYLVCQARYRQTTDEEPGSIKQRTITIKYDDAGKLAALMDAIMAAHDDEPPAEATTARRSTAARGALLPYAVGQHHWVHTTLAGLLRSADSHALPELTLCCVSIEQATRAPAYPSYNTPVAEYVHAPVWLMSW